MILTIVLLVSSVVGNSLIMPLLKVSLKDQFCQSFLSIANNEPVIMLNQLTAYATHLKQSSSKSNMKLRVAPLDTTNNLHTTKVLGTLISL